MLCVQGMVTHGHVKKLRKIAANGGLSLRHDQAMPSANRCVLSPPSVIHRAKEHHSSLCGQVLPSRPHADHGGADSVGFAHAHARTLLGAGVISKSGRFEHIYGRNTKPSFDVSEHSRRVVVECASCFQQQGRKCSSHSTPTRLCVFLRISMNEDSVKLD